MTNTSEIEAHAELLVLQFCAWYFGKDANVDVHNIGDDYFGVWGINDEFWNFSEIVRVLDAKDRITPDELSKWYWDNIEGGQKINFKSYLMMKENQ